MNARGIPTAAYQVLHLLSEVGYPPSRGSPQPGLTGGRGVPEVGVPPSQVWWGGVLEVGYHPGQVGYPLQQGYPPPAGPGWGTPAVVRQMDGQTRVKTLPSRRTTYAVGNDCYILIWRSVLSHVLTPKDTEIRPVKVLTFVTIVDGQNRFHTHSACQSARHHWHNVKILTWLSVSVCANKALRHNIFRLIWQ